MLTARVIPCLDVRDGRVVKGVRFANLRDAGSPAELAAVYEAQGADELVVLDISATPEGRRTQADTVRAVRAAISIPLTVGGGVRGVDDAGRLLEAGADKVGVNTAAVERPELIAEIAARYGAQCAVLALDAARRETEHVQHCGAGIARAPILPQEVQAGRPHHNVSPWEVVTLSGKTRTALDAVAWAQRAAALGAGEILLTSWDRDGTRSGYDLDLLRAICGTVSVPVIASGGAATPAHLAEALRAGASAVLAASIFHDGDTTVDRVKRELASLGLPMRI